MACTWNGWSHHWRVVTPKHLLHWYDDLVFMQKILLLFLILFFSLKNSYSDNKTLPNIKRQINNTDIHKIIYSLYLTILFIDLFNIIISDIYLIKVLIISDNKKVN